MIDIACEYIQYALVSQRILLLLFCKKHHLTKHADGIYCTQSYAGSPPRRRVAPLIYRENNEMQQPGPKGMTASAQTNLAAQVRDSLVLNEAVIVECVNEVLGEMPPHKAEVFRRMLKSSPAFGAAIKRVTVDVGVVLSLAKSFESDDEFSDSAGLVHDINFSAHDGKVGAYAREMVESDLKSAVKAESGVFGEDAILYDLIPADVLIRRLRLLLAFMDQATKVAS